MILGCQKFKESLAQGILTDGLGQGLFKKVGYSVKLRTAGHRGYLESEGTEDIFTLFGTGDISARLAQGTLRDCVVQGILTEMLGTEDTYKLFGMEEHCCLFFTVILQSIWNRGYLKTL